MKPDALIGKTFGKAQIVSEVGRGGMSIVYKAKHTVWEKFVAVKVLYKGRLFEDQESLERFQNEAKALGRLDHPYIVVLYDYGEEEGVQYMITQFVEGPTLQQKIRQQGRLSLAETVKMVKEVLLGLSYAHGKDLVHRDLKPSNIMFDMQENVRITDFGLVKILDDCNPITVSGEPLGTPHYMSPEQWDGNPPAPGMDIWALGVTWYYALTGTLPFEGDKTSVIFRNIMVNEIPRLITLNIPIPEEFEEILRKMTQKDPALRYQTSDEVLVDFNQAVQQHWAELVLMPSSLLGKKIAETSRKKAWSPFTKTEPDTPPKLTFPAEPEEARTKEYPIRPPDSVEKSAEKPGKADGRKKWVNSWKKIGGRIFQRVPVFWGRFASFCKSVPWKEKVEKNIFFFKRSGLSLRALFHREKKPGFFSFLQTKARSFFSHFRIFFRQLLLRATGNEKLLSGFRFLKRQFEGLSLSKKRISEPPTDPGKEGIKIEGNQERTDSEKEVVPAIVGPDASKEAKKKSGVEEVARREEEPLLPITRATEKAPEIFVAERATQSRISPPAGPGVGSVSFFRKTFSPIGKMVSKRKSFGPEQVPLEKEGPDSKAKKPSLFARWKRMVPYLSLKYWQFKRYFKIAYTVIFFSLLLVSLGIYLSHRRSEGIEEDRVFQGLVEKRPDIERNLERHRDYLKRYPEGKYAQEVQKRIDRMSAQIEHDRFYETSLARALEFRRNGKLRETLDSLRQYARKYPEGIHKAKVEQEIEKIEKELEISDFREIEEKVGRSSAQEIRQAYLDYLARYPQGENASKAREALARYDFSSLRQKASVLPPQEAKVLYEWYLLEHSASVYASKAKEEIARCEYAMLKEKAESSSDQEAKALYEQYLADHPEGENATEAKSLLEKVVARIEAENLKRRLQLALAFLDQEDVGKALALYAQMGNRGEVYAYKKLAAYIQEKKLSSRQGIEIWQAFLQHFPNGKGKKSVLRRIEMLKQKEPGKSASPEVKKPENPPKAPSKPSKAEIFAKLFGIWEGHYVAPEYKCRLEVMRAGRLVGIMHFDNRRQKGSYYVNLEIDDAGYVLIQGEKWIEKPDEEIDFINLEGKFTDSSYRALEGQVIFAKFGTRYGNFKLLKKSGF